MKAFTKIAAAFLFIGPYLFCLHFSTHRVSAQQQPSAAGIELFEKKIRPVLESNCYMCHSTHSKKLQGGLLLDSREGMLKGGNSGQPAIRSGDPDSSLLIKAIRYSDPKLQMPPMGQLGEAHPFPPESEWHYTQHEQFFAVYDTNRRSVYLMQQRQKKHPLMEVFDGADTNTITSPRLLSTTPLQALYLMNNPFVHQQADLFAVRVGMAYDMLPQRINYAFLLAYGRPAKLAEIREAIAYIQQVRQELLAVKTPTDQLTRASLASYLRVVLGSDEFLYVE